MSPELAELNGKVEKNTEAILYIKASTEASRATLDKLSDRHEVALEKYQDGLGKLMDKINEITDKFPTHHEFEYTMKGINARIDKQNERIVRIKEKQESSRDKYINGTIAIITALVIGFLSNKLF